MRLAARAPAQLAAGTSSLIASAPAVAAVLGLLLATISASPMATMAAAETEPGSVDERVLQRIGFGSCVHQDKPQPIWDAIVAARPDLFLLLGDNVYADSLDPAAARAALGRLGRQPGYRRLAASTPILAVWDDHDYGLDDSGGEHPAKEAMKDVFLGFFADATSAQRRTHAGIYAARSFGPPGRRVRVVLLDTRTFRGPLRTGAVDESAVPVRAPYVPNPDRTSSMLGEAQWRWLERQLAEPAVLTILASSIQVLSAQHGWEKWENLPHERERLLRLIEHAASPVIVVSGDRHRAEISRAQLSARRTLYDVTSSSLNRPIETRGEKNRHRVGELYAQANFGLITIDWERRIPVATVEIRCAAGEPVLLQRIALGEAARPHGALRPHTPRRERRFSAP